MARSLPDLPAAVHARSENAGFPGRSERRCPSSAPGRREPHRRLGLGASWNPRDGTGTHARPRSGLGVQPPSTSAPSSSVPIPGSEAKAGPHLHLPTVLGRQAALVSNQQPGAAAGACGGFPSLRGPTKLSVVLRAQIQSECVAPRPLILPRRASSESPAKRPPPQPRGLRDLASHSLSPGRRSLGKGQGLAGGGEARGREWGAHARRGPGRGP